MPSFPEPLPGLDVRVPAWDRDTLEDRPCPFCGSAGEVRWVRPDRLAVRACGACGACFLSPAPPESGVEALYRDYQRSRCVEGHVRGETPIEDAIGEPPRSDIRIAEIDSMIDLRGCRLLDVGFGSGIVLHRFRALGAEVAGIDPDPGAVAFVRETLGIPDVRACALADLPPDARYDVVTLFDVIEHVARPLDLLRAAAQRVRPAGLLAIWTPDASFAAEDPAPVLFRVDLEHLQYLSARACAHLARRLDMEIVHLESVGFPFLDRILSPGPGSGACSRGRSRLRRGLRRLPGFRRVNAVRRLLLARMVPPPDPRRGRYHLFCIYRRPAGGGNRGRREGHAAGSGVDRGRP